MTTVLVSPPVINTVVVTETDEVIQVTEQEGVSVVASPDPPVPEVIEVLGTGPQGPPGSGTNPTLHTGSYSLTDVAVADGEWVPGIEIADLTTVPERHWTGRVRIGLWIDADPGADWWIGLESPFFGDLALGIRGTGDIGTGPSDLAWISGEEAPAGVVVGGEPSDPSVLDEMASLQPAERTWNIQFYSYGGAFTVKKVTLEFQDEVAPDILTSQQVRIHTKTSGDWAGPALEVIARPDIKDDGYTGNDPVAAKFVGRLIVEGQSRTGQPVLYIDTASGGDNVGGYIQGLSNTGADARYGGFAVEEAVTWNEDFSEVIPYGDRNNQAAFTTLAITDEGGFTHRRPFVAYMSGRTKIELIEDVVGLTVRGKITGGQTANLQEWINSAGTAVSSVSADGKSTIQPSTDTQALVLKRPEGGDPFTSLIQFQNEDGDFIGEISPSIMGLYGPGASTFYIWDPTIASSPDADENFYIYFDPLHGFDVRRTAGSTTFRTGPLGSSSPRWRLQTDGAMQWANDADNATPDTRLRRTAAGELTVDDGLGGSGRLVASNLAQTLPTLTAGNYKNVVLGVDGGSSGPNERLVYMPLLWVDRTRSFDRIGLNVTTAGGSASTIRFGIYADNGSFKPGALITDFGSVAANTTGFKEKTISLTLTPGVYWIACVANGNGGSAPSTARTNPMALGIHTTTGGSWGILARDFNADGALPDPANIDYPGGLGNQPFSVQLRAS